MDSPKRGATKSSLGASLETPLTSRSGSKTPKRATTRGSATTKGSGQSPSPKRGAERKTSGAAGGAAAGANEKRPPPPLQKADSWQVPKREEERVPDSLQLALESVHQIADQITTYEETVKQMEKEQGLMMQVRSDVDDRIDLLAHDSHAPLREVEESATNLEETLQRTEEELRENGNIVVKALDSLAKISELGPERRTKLLEIKDQFRAILVTQIETARKAVVDLATVVKELKSVENELIKTQELLATEIEEGSKLQSRVKQLTLAVAEVESRAKAEMTQMQYRLEQQKQECNEQLQLIETLKADIQEGERELQAMTSDRDRLLQVEESQQKAIEGHLREIQAFRAKFDMQQEENEHLQTVNSALQSRLQDATNESKNLREQLASTNSSLDSAKQQLHEKSEEIEHMTDKHIKELHELEIAIDSKDEMIESLRTSIQLSEDQRAQQEAELAQAEQTKIALKEAQTKAMTAAKNAAALKQQVTKLEDRAKQLQTQMTQQKSKYEREISKLQRTMKEQAAQNAPLMTVSKMATSAPGTAGGGEGEGGGGGGDGQGDQQQQQQPQDQAQAASDEGGRTEDGETGRVLETPESFSENQGLIGDAQQSGAALDPEQLKEQGEKKELMDEMEKKIRQQLQEERQAKLLLQQQQKQFEQMQLQFQQQQQAAIAAATAAVAAATASGNGTIDPNVIANQIQMQMQQQQQQMMMAMVNSNNSVLSASLGASAPGADVTSKRATGNAAIAAVMAGVGANTWTQGEQDASQPKMPFLSAAPTSPGAGMLFQPGQQQPQQAWGNNFGAGVHSPILQQQQQWMSHEGVIMSSSGAEHDSSDDDDDEDDSDDDDDDDEEDDSGADRSSHRSPSPSVRTARSGKSASSARSRGSSKGKERSDMTEVAVGNSPMSSRGRSEDSDRKKKKKKTKKEKKEKKKKKKQQQQQMMMMQQQQQHQHYHYHPHHDGGSSPESGRRSPSVVNLPPAPSSLPFNEVSLSRQSIHSSHSTLPPVQMRSAGSSLAMTDLMSRMALTGGTMGGASVGLGATLPSFNQYFGSTSGSGAPIFQSPVLPASAPSSVQMMMMQQQQLQQQQQQPPIQTTLGLVAPDATQFFMQVRGKLVQLQLPDDVDINEDAFDSDNEEKAYFPMPKHAKADIVKKRMQTLRAEIKLSQNAIDKLQSSNQQLENELVHAKRQLQRVSLLALGKYGGVLAAGGGANLTAQSALSSSLNNSGIQTNNNNSNNNINNNSSVNNLSAAAAASPSKKLMSAATANALATAAAVAASGQLSEDILLPSPRPILFDRGVQCGGGPGGGVGGASGDAVATVYVTPVRTKKVITRGGMKNNNNNNMMANMMMSRTPEPVRHSHFGMQLDMPTPVARKQKLPSMPGFGEEVIGGGGGGEGAGFGFVSVASTVLRKRVNAVRGGIEPTPSPELR